MSSAPTLGPDVPAAKPRRRRTASAAAPGKVRPSDDWRADGVRPKVALDYTADDFRQELARVERRLFRLSVASIIVAVLAVVAIVYLLFFQ